MRRKTRSRQVRAGQQIAAILAWLFLAAAVLVGILYFGGAFSIDDSGAALLMNLLDPIPQRR